MAELRPFDEPMEGASGQVVYKVASTQHDREAAFRLVYDAYRRLEIVPENRFRMRVTPHHLLPTTDVFVALHRGRALCTLTLVRDADLGVPMQDVYAEELTRRRRHGICLGEASSLAIRRSERQRLFPVFIRLTQLMFRCSEHRGVQQIVIAVHPRHACFYQRLMKFRVIGEQRAYPRVGNQPAVALCLDFERMRREHPDTYRVLFGASLTDEQLRPWPMSNGERAYFRPAARLFEDPTSTGDVDDASVRSVRQQPYRRTA